MGTAMRKGIWIISLLTILQFGCASTSSIMDDPLKSLLKNYTVPDVRTILVLPIENYSTYASINTAELYNKITMGLYADKRFRVVDRISLDKILEEQKLQQTGLISLETAVNIGSVAGADLIFVTRIEQNTIMYKIINVETSEVMAYQYEKIYDQKQYESSMGSDYQPEIRTGWIPGDRYQQNFDEILRLGYYPVKIKGRNYNGSSQYYGVYRMNKDNITWATHHDLTREMFDQKKKEYKSQGLKMVFTNAFKDAAGTERFNAIWHLKKSNQVR